MFRGTSGTVRSVLARAAVTLLALAGVAAFVCVELDVGDALATGPTAQKKKKGRGKAKKAAGRGAAASASARPLERTQPYTACPSEMVSVQGQFCIDRWEAGTADLATGKDLSPYYPPHPRLLSWVFNTWATNLARERAQAMGWIDAGAMEGGRAEARSPQLVSVWYEPEAGTTMWEGGLPEGATATPPDGGAGVLPLGAVMPLPEVPSWQSGGGFRPVATSRAGVIPQGSTPGFVAAQACRAAGKRLCRESEWVLACKGDKGTKFPYAEQYRQGACNVFRADHPARILHGNASEGLSDPRLNQVLHESAMLLRETAGSPQCKSVWGADAIYDMVGNLDEWVDDPDGMFLGGFYARATRNGCESKITAHPTGYFDYSLGFRCCADLAGRK